MIRLSLHVLPQPHRAQDLRTLSRMQSMAQAVERLYRRVRAAPLCGTICRAARKT
jgi:hypothetical protein